MTVGVVKRLLTPDWFSYSICSGLVATKHVMISATSLEFHVDGGSWFWSSSTKTSSSTRGKGITPSRGAYRTPGGAGNVASSSYEIRYHRQGTLIDECRCLLCVGRRGDPMDPDWGPDLRTVLDPMVLAT